MGFIGVRASWHLPDLQSGVRKEGCPLKPGRAVPLSQVRVVLKANLEKRKVFEEGISTSYPMRLGPSPCLGGPERGSLAGTVWDGSWRLGAGMTGQDFKRMIEKHVWVTPQKAFSCLKTVIPRVIMKAIMWEKYKLVPLTLMKCLSSSRVWIIVLTLTTTLRSGTLTPIL